MDSIRFPVPIEKIKNKTYKHKYTAYKYTLKLIG